MSDAYWISMAFAAAWIDWQHKCCNECMYTSDAMLLYKTMITDSVQAVGDWIKTHGNGLRFIPEIICTIDQVITLSDNK